MSYKVFRRSARSFDELVKARKYTIRDRVATVEEARRICREYNEHRDSTQIAAGTKYEFTER